MDDFAGNGGELVASYRCKVSTSGLDAAPPRLAAIIGRKTADVGLDGVERGDTKDELFGKLIARVLSHVVCIMNGDGRSSYGNILILTTRARSKIFKFVWSNA